MFFVAYKMRLEKAAQPKLVRKIKERTRGRLRGLISRLYNTTAIDKFGYANYSQSAHRDHEQHAGRSLRERSYSFFNRFWSIACRY